MILLDNKAITLKSYFIDHVFSVISHGIFYAAICDHYFSLIFVPYFANYLKNSYARQTRHTIVNYAYSAYFYRGDDVPGNRYSCQ